MKNILELLENSEKLYPDKTAVSDGKRTITYSRFKTAAMETGSYIASNFKFKRRPIAIYMEKSIETLISMMGTVYSGNFYVILDIKMPAERLSLITNNLEPELIITDGSHLSKSKEIFPETKIISIDAVPHNINNSLLSEIRNKTIDTDLLYVLYTSGSTGIPKGVAVSHKNVISYSKWVIDTFNINNETVFGNQTPFYFSMSVLDIYASLRTGAELCIIPQSLFSFPLELLKFIDENKINTIYWVPSALALVANWKAFDYCVPKTLKKVLFAGETMPMKQLNVWRKHLPGVLFANLFGPTEVTDICAYYILDRSFQDDESLPIGKPCDNCALELIPAEGDNTQTELCVRGSIVAMGYYNNPKKTAEVFVQNPNNTCYPEIIYKTGDLVELNDKGELIYLGRKDHQIKHMGYRIELGEIENAINSIPNVQASSCIYDEEQDKIAAFLQTDSEIKEIKKIVKEKLPKYMIPAKWVFLNKMFYNSNGKIDRNKLKNLYIKGEV